jgi:hypothetical protein
MRSYEGLLAAKVPSGAFLSDVRGVSVAVTDVAA